MKHKALLFLALAGTSAFAMNNIDIAAYQNSVSGLPTGERIALWAEKFLGTPYDPDPLGEYVREKTVVADERVDCMYLTFRAVELALSMSPEGAINEALDKRFRRRGLLKDGFVANYEERFEYGEDMIDSGKWGREITSELGAVTYVEGTRGRDKTGIVSKDTLNAPALKEKKFRSGDIVFFVTYPDKRVSDEIIGHIGIIKVEKDVIHLIHASGLKNKGGEVRKVLLYDYLKTMPFSGIRVTRFE